MMGRKKCWYSVGDIYENKDKSYPHVTAILTEDIVLPENIPTLFELFILMNLTKMRTSDGVLETNTCIPVTIISMGGCNIRVLHGYIDARKRCIKLQMSQMFNFDKAGGYMTDDWTRLLCWLLAEPVEGSTA